MSKQEADNCKKIEIWWLLRDIKKSGGYKYTTVTWGESGSVAIQVSVNNSEKYARFIYTQISNKKDFDYKVQILQTSCSLGGYRYWFKCPLYKNNQPCGKRVGVLYKDGELFGCRHCYELTYKSRKVDKKSRLYPMFRIIELRSDIDKLESEAKRYTYKGKLTKKRQRLEKLYSKSMSNLRDFQRTEKGLNFNKKGRSI